MRLGMDEDVERMGKGVWGFFGIYYVFWFPLEDISIIL